MYKLVKRSDEVSSHDTFDEALSAYKSLAAKRGKLELHVYNDNTYCGCGECSNSDLTDDEREAFEAVQ